MRKIHHYSLHSEDWIGNLRSSGKGSSLLSRKTIRHVF